MYWMHMSFCFVILTLYRQCLMYWTFLTLKRKWKFNNLCHSGWPRCSVPDQTTLICREDFCENVENCEAFLNISIGFGLNFSLKLIENYQYSDAVIYISAHVLPYLLFDTIWYRHILHWNKFSKDGQAVHILDFLTKLGAVKIKREQSKYNQKEKHVIGCVIFSNGLNISDT